MKFEWNEDKNQQNIAKHSIDFNDAIQIFMSEVLVFPSPRNEEARSVALGKYNQRLIAVVFTMRKGVYRIISTRIARKKERIRYEQNNS